MEIKPIKVYLCILLASCTFPAQADYFIGYQLQYPSYHTNCHHRYHHRYVRRYSPYIYVYRERCYDPDLTTGDDDPCVYPDMDIDE